MSKARVIAGIELGSSKITTLIAQVNVEPTELEPTINIIGVSSVESKGIRKGQIVNIEEAVEAAIASVEAAERMAGSRLESAFVAIGGAHVLSQNSHGVVAISDPNGEVSAQDMERVIEAASAVSMPSSREVLHVIPREYIVDGEGGVKDPIGMAGVRLEVDTHLVTASSAAVKNLKKAVNEVGLKVDEMVYSGFAASASTLSDTEKELGCVLVDIGGGTTSIAAFIEGSLSFSGVVPIGAKNVTNDLAIGLRVSLETAEKIKLALSADAANKLKQKTETEDIIDLTTLGLTEIKNVSKKTLTEGIIRPRLNEIFTMVRIELEKVGLAARVPSGVIVTGGGAHTVGIIDSAKRMMALPARIGEPKGVKGLIDDIMDPAFSVVIGLIIYGAKQGSFESTSSFSITDRFKLPSKGGLGKIIETIKDLLP